MANNIEHLNDPIVNRAIRTFNRDLVKEHVFLPHNVLPIDKGFTIMDGLCYIFDNDVLAIADVIQSYADSNKHAEGLMTAIADGVRTKTVCLQCIRESVGLNRS